MNVVRYTFDVCFRDHVSKDAYSMTAEIEKNIMRCDGVCGCEGRIDKEGFSSVNVDSVVNWQRRKGKWLDEK